MGPLSNVQVGGNGLHILCCCVSRMHPCRGVAYGNGSLAMQVGSNDLHGLCCCGPCGGVGLQAALHQLNNGCGAVLRRPAQHSRNGPHHAVIAVATAKQRESPVRQACTAARRLHACRAAGAALPPQRPALAAPQQPLAGGDLVDDPGQGEQVCWGQLWPVRGGGLCFSAGNTAS